MICWQATLATATQKETSQIRKDTNEAVEQLHVGKLTPRLRSYNRIAI